MDPNFEKPIPRAPRSPGYVARVQVKNRRREHLARHPSYFDSLEHELTDPILYERLIKRFQTPAERQAEGKTKGYGRTLEASLLRGEQKLEHVESQANGSQNGTASHAEDSVQDSGLQLAWERSAAGKEEGTRLWHDFLEDRFVRGLDDEFDYGPVDQNEDLDYMAKQDAQDAWFDEEEPSWVADEAQPAKKQGETGVQDF